MVEISVNLSILCDIIQLGIFCVLEETFMATNSNRNTQSRKKSSSSSRGSSSKTTGTKRSTSKKNNSNKNNNRMSDEELLFLNYSVIAITIFACLMLFLSNFGKIGAVGNVLSSIMFGLFGSLAYIFPIFLLVYAFLWIARQADDSLGFKMMLMVLLFIFSAIFCDLTKGYTNLYAEYNIKDVWMCGYQDKIGGGLIAASIAFLMKSLFDKMASVAICVLCIIICLFLLVGKYLINAFAGSGENLKNTARNMGEYKREMDEYRRDKLNERRIRKQREDEYEEYDEDDPEARFLKAREERHRKQRLKNEQREAQKEAMSLAKEEAETDNILRMDKKRTGVSTDTTLKESNASKRKDGMHEIVIKDEKATNVRKEVAVALDNSPYDGNIKFHMADNEDLSENENIFKSSDDEIEPISLVVEEQKIPSFMNNTKIEREVSESKKPEEIVQKSKVDETQTGTEKKIVKKTKKYVFPTVNLLENSTKSSGGSSRDELGATARKLEDALKSFGVDAKVTDISQGPSVTRYELEPAVGVKVSKITALADDLKLHLAAKDIRIEAPIPGKSAVGIEVPNSQSSGVRLRELIEDNEFKKFDGNMVFAVGKDIAGKTVVADISKMPHMLIAGSTGSGKSVCINTIIMSILYKHSPDDVQLIMVDPKVVELNVYNGIPHLMIPVVTDPKKAATALNWAVAEMTDRYKKFADLGVRDLKGYNKKIETIEVPEGEEAPVHLPQILIIVDELADLMMVAAKEVEEAICRLAQLARACGIHLILATQRPSVDVITGLIKANMPSRVAFAVTSGTDSRTILDMNGAEKLLGKGDMLFFPQGYTKPNRVQGAFVDDSEVQKVVDFVKTNNANYDKSQDASDAIANFGGSQTSSSNGGNDNSATDELFVSAGKFIIEQEKASIGNLQRKFRIGFNRAARIMDELCDAGVVGAEQGTKPREILMSLEQFEQYIDEYYV